MGLKAVKQNSMSIVGNPIGALASCEVASWIRLKDIWSLVSLEGDTDRLDWKVQSQRVIWGEEGESANPVRICRMVTRIGRKDRIGRMLIRIGRIWQDQAVDDARIGERLSYKCLCESVFWRSLSVKTTQTPQCVYVLFTHLGNT